MKKKKILLHTNPTWIKTGLAENAKTLLKYLWNTQKYELVHYCSQVSVADQSLTLTPWKSVGCIPNNPNVINEINRDPQRARNVSYGSYNIDRVIMEEKPDIYISSDDIWAVTKSDYLDKPWYKHINSVLHITIDSVPILDQAFEQAGVTKTYVTWAKFAKNEMHRVGDKFKHVSQIYGAMDTEIFKPISSEEKAALRKRFNIDQDTKIFLFVFRNQLRKSANLCMDAFAQFKRENPNVKAKLFFHTSFSEKGNGWDIPKMANYYGIKLEDVLCTYVCRKCKTFFVAPYQGEDLNCPVCGEQKSLITVNIQDGVPASEMRYIYGISDACLSIFTSGGQEYHSVQSLLCGKPLACTNYSCGEDFCQNDFVTPIKYHPAHEAGTNFIKAASDVNQIKQFIKKMCKISPLELSVIASKGRRWAIENFSIETIGKQWEDLFDTLPEVDWSNFTNKTDLKNPDHPFVSDGLDDLHFLKGLYKDILLSDEPENSEGMLHWLDKIRNGVSRKDIYDFFIDVARKDNANSQPVSDLGDLLDKNGKNRGLLVMKESIGDIFIITSLFESFHNSHPNTDLYVACDQKFFDILAGNEMVHRVLHYHPAFENEMAMIGAGQKDRYFDYYYHPAIPTQRQLSYLSHPEPAFNIQYK